MILSPSFLFVFLFVLDLYSFAYVPLPTRMRPWLYGGLVWLLYFCLGHAICICDVIPRDIIRRSQRVCCVLDGGRELE
ncbi:uncharacterized protein BDV17DRAFT_126936 [Aspergillus undulatus]|uniref:uncharacterized protein n=1 Tax=Aspergillus undulatus TaxID=1810928 RepID=UPI003CCD9C19